MLRNIFPALVLCVIAISVATASPLAANGGVNTTRISEGSDSAQGNGTSSTAFLNATGRFVAFVSSSSNWLPGDNNSTLDIFLKDRATGAIELASRTSGGGFADGASVSPSVSADGRYVVFASFATNLVPNDSNGALDVFIRDRVAGTTTRITQDAGSGASWPADSVQGRISDDGLWVVYSTLYDYAPEDNNGFRDVYLWNRLTGSHSLVSHAQGIPGDGDSEWPDLSADGRYVVFDSYAQNFPGGDPNVLPDIYLADRVSGTLERISLTTGSGGSEVSLYPRVSDDGRFVTFQSSSSTLVPGDTNGLPDIYLFDRDIDATTRVSLGPNGEQPDGVSEFPDISGDGQTVAYESLSGVLVPGDANGRYDIFLYDRAGGTTTLASLTSTGAQGNNDSERASLGASGITLAFHSRATNLVPGDTNDRTDVFARGEPYAPGEPTATPTATVVPPTHTATATGIPPTVTATATGVLMTPTATATPAGPAVTATATVPSTPTSTTVPPTVTPTTTPSMTPAPSGTPAADRAVYLPLVRAHQGVTSARAAR